MCGIAGFWGAPDAALLATMTSRIAHRGPDGEGFFEHPLASLGSPAPRHHRPRGRAPARRHRRRPRAAHLQRRGLQLPRAARGARTARAHVPHPLRHRGRAARLPRVGDRLLRPLQRDVGARRCSTCARHSQTPRARPRPLRHQAAVLRAVDLGPGAVRVGGQGGARRSRARDRARPAVAVRLPAPRAPRPQAADRVLRHPRAGRGHVGGRRRRRRARADLLDAHAHDRRRARPGRVPRTLRAFGGAPTGRRRPCGHVPLGRDRLVVDREGVEPAARRARARRGVAGRPPQDVLDRLRRRSHRRARVHGRGARRSRRRARVRGADVGAVHRRDRPDGVAPGRADRVDRPVRAVVRHAPGAAQGHGPAERAGWRRAARGLRAVPVRLPARAAPAAQARRVHA